MAAAKKLLQPFDPTLVRIEDDFWSPRLETNRKVTIPYLYRQCKKTGRFDAFQVNWKPPKPHRPHPFWDSDVAKWLEAASYSLATHPEGRLTKRLEEVVDLIVSAQQPDGYLNTYFTAVAPGKRWTNLRDSHELYCAGHLVEAAVAHFQATGNRKLLDAMCRYADHIGRVFGAGRGKKRGYPGHEEIELALVKLYRATGERRYLKLAKFFIDDRGRRPSYFEIEARARGERPENLPQLYNYYQAHKPVRRQREAVGHAVRAMYLYCGMADVAAETLDAKLLTACRRLWQSVTKQKMYVTGGIGARRAGEAFGEAYELPNESAYAETCAAVGLIFFAHRMLQIERDGKYADVMERALYNAVLSGVGLDGRRFFYVNPLASAGGHHRKGWFDVACCPPNLSRMLASLGKYIYSAANDAAYVHLYVGGSAAAKIAGQKVTLRQKTNYPWDGEVKITIGVEKPRSFALLLRLPGWCREYRVRVNDEPLTVSSSKGYLKLRRRWSDGDRVQLSLAMPIERIAAHPSVAASAEKVAIQRGPIVYCLEGCDHSADVRNIMLPDQAKLTARFDPGLSGLNGCIVVEGTGKAPSLGEWKKALYRPAAETKSRPVKIKAIPYFLWDNRKPGAMVVFIPRA